MSYRYPKYPLLDNIHAIQNHTQLPYEAVELGQIEDKESLEGGLYIFVKNKDHLSILKPEIYQLKGHPPKYDCSQMDFPLEAISWIPQALQGFREGKGGGGIMTSADHDVGGEMLAIVTAIGLDDRRGGYYIENKSRCDRRIEKDNINGFFTPHRVSWPARFLYEGGLMDFLKDLAHKYENGLI